MNASPSNATRAARLALCLAGALLAAGPATADDAALRDAWREADLVPAFGTAVAPDAVDVRDGIVTVRVTLPASYLEGFDGDDMERVSMGTRRLVDVDAGLRGLRFEARADGAEAYRPLVDYLPAVPPAPAKPAARPAKYTRQTMPDRTDNRPYGALTGASIFVSAGHGWYWSDKLGKWTTQRSNSHGILEDHFNAEAVNQYLLKYLWNAGADVYPVRERDMQTNMVVVEPGIPGYSQTGDWTIENTPAASGTEQRSAATVAGDPTAMATFAPAIPEAGEYAVYVRYSPSTSGPTTQDATIVVNHTGGATTWTQDQNHDGWTWKYIGTFHFDAGRSIERGSVVVTNSASSGGRVVADAVRFGGGIGDIVDGEGGASGRPRWEESGYYYAKFMGFDPAMDTRNFSTVSAMPLYSEWEAEEWEAGRSIYVSWHGNAHNTQARGLFSFVYGPNEWGQLDEFTGYPGGVELVHAVHDEIANDVLKGYDANWRIGPKVCRWLGETNPKYNGKMPAALFEMGFFDNPEDAKYMLDPKFRQIVARALYQGIVRYYHENVEGFTIPTLLPEPPTHLHVVTDFKGDATLRWREPAYDTGDGLLGDPALDYRVYRSSNGKGWDNGIAVDATELSLAGMKDGEIVYFRVTAANVGGESLPTETVAVRTTERGRSEVLVVNGFDRLDAEMNLLGETSERRGILAKMNTFDYCIQHADAIATTGRFFDGTSNEAVEAGLVDLENYKTVVWMLGKEAQKDECFSAIERRVVRDFVARGGGLFVSGAHAASDLSRTDDGRAFLRDVLGAEFLVGDVAADVVTGGPGSMFDGLGFLDFGDAKLAAYPVPGCDVVGPVGNAAAALVYSGEGTSSLTAAIQSPSGAVYLAFPFETIEDPRKRASLMSRALHYLESRPKTQNAGGGG